MVTGFSNILTSTTLNSSHNGVILVSGNTTLSLPSASSNTGIQFTIKKIDTSASTVTISGTIDGESDPQLTEQNSYITIISNGNAWYKVAEYVSAETSTENQTYISNSLGMTFRLIPAGTFVMGSPSDELGRGSDETQYTVTISESFYIQTTEVTQGQWKAVMGNNPSSFDSCGLNCPVEYISWEDAEDFIMTLNAMGEGSYTFPTEAQWEYAARAGSNKAFANGDISNTTTDSNLDVMGWYSSNSGSTPHAVAQKQPNAWGLYDMHGNVWEWCHDWYGSYPDISVTDPGGPSSGSFRVLRGGSWYSDAQSCRSAGRYIFSPGNRDYYIGLRLSRTLKP
jgi:formylglycine-generating enzyme required for sulfatase activity